MPREYLYVPLIHSPDRVTDQAPPPSPAHPRDTGLALIAIYKLVKTVLLIIVGLGATNVLGRDVAEQARQWMAAISFAGEPHYLRSILGWVSGLSAVRIRELGIVAFGYAALYAAEGIGLWLEQRWAEYLTIVATGIVYSDLDIRDNSEHHLAQGGGLYRQCANGGLHSIFGGAEPPPAPRPSSLAFVRSPGIFL